MFCGRFYNFEKSPFWVKTAKLGTEICIFSTKQFSSVLNSRYRLTLYDHQIIPISLPYAPTYPKIMLYDSHITLAPLDCPRMIRSCYLELKTPNTFWKKTFSTEGFATSYNVALVLFGYRLYLQCRWWHSRCGGNRFQSFCILTVEIQKQYLFLCW